MNKFTDRDKVKINPNVNLLLINITDNEVDITKVYEILSIHDVNYCRYGTLIDNTNHPQHSKIQYRISCGFTFPETFLMEVKNALV